MNNYYQYQKKAFNFLLIPPLFLFFSFFFISMISVFVEVKIAAEVLENHLQTENLSQTTPLKPKVCLNMIVKDESHVIERCLESVRPFIDYWVIVDTGSSDDTIEKIKEFLNEIPGEIHERPWVNFGHNRNEALELAKGKGNYFLFMDADEQLKYDKSYSLPLLDKDFYYIQMESEGTRYKRALLINSKYDWKWKGVLHEAIYSTQALSHETLQNIVNIGRHEGNRSKDPQKYAKDAALLEKALISEPENSRYVFYLAQSYRDANNPEKALIHYEKRTSMLGWNEEVYYSLLQAALLKETLKKSSQEVIHAYQKAIDYRPTRPEPYYYLARYQRTIGNYHEAYAKAHEGLKLKKSLDLLFVEKWIEDYGLLHEYSIACYWTNRFLESFLASQLLFNKDMPVNFKESVERNHIWIIQKLYQ